MMVQPGEDVICAFIDAGHAGTEKFVEKKIRETITTAQRSGVAPKRHLKTQRPKRRKGQKALVAALINVATFDVLVI